MLGTDGKLWLEQGPFGKVPPPRRQVDGNVVGFQALSDSEVLVLGYNLNLWLEHGPFGNVPPSRQQVDGNVRAFQALSDTEILVLGTDGNLWLEHGPFGNVPPTREQVDGNVAIGVPAFTPGDLTVNPKSIVFSSKVDLEGLANGSIQGPVGVTITDQGNYNFTGQLNNSAWLPYNFSVLVVLVSNGGRAFLFGVSGSIGAGVPFSNNNYTWNNNGNNGTIGNVWADLQAGCTYHYTYAANTDLSTLWNDLQSAIGFVKNVIEIVGRLK